MSIIHLSIYVLVHLSIIYKYISRKWLNFKLHNYVLSKYCKVTPNYLIYLFYIPIYLYIFNLTILYICISNYLSLYLYSFFVLDSLYLSYYAYFTYIYMYTIFLSSYLSMKLSLLSSYISFIIYLPIYQKKIQSLSRILVNINLKPKLQKIISNSILFQALTKLSCKTNEICQVGTIILFLVFAIFTVKVRST